MICPKSWTNQNVHEKSFHFQSSKLKILHFKHFFHSSTPKDEMKNTFNGLTMEAVGVVVKDEEDEVYDVEWLLFQWRNIYIICIPFHSKCKGMETDEFPSLFCSFHSFCLSKTKGKMMKNIKALF